MYTMRFHGAIHIAQRQKSKELIADTNLLTECELTLILYNQFSAGSVLGRMMIAGNSLLEDTIYTIGVTCSYASREPGETSNSFVTNDKPNCTKCVPEPRQGELSWKQVRCLILFCTVYKDTISFNRVFRKFNGRLANMPKLGK